MAQKTYAGVSVDINEEGYFTDPSQWTKEIAVDVAKQEGVDIHDLGMWGSREASIENKPYVITAGADISDWENPQTAGQFESQIRSQIGGVASSITMHPLPAGIQSRVVMAAKNTRARDIQQLYNGYGAI